MKMEYELKSFKKKNILFTVTLITKILFTEFF